MPAHPQWPPFPAGISIILATYGTFAIAGPGLNQTHWWYSWREGHRGCMTSGGTLLRAAVSPLGYLLPSFTTLTTQRKPLGVGRTYCPQSHTRRDWSGVGHSQGNSQLQSDHAKRSSRILDSPDCPQNIPQLPWLAAWEVISVIAVTSRWGWQGWSAWPGQLLGLIVVFSALLTLCLRLNSF